ncbi:putative alcohol dehydrogenase [Diplodia seriata]|uniref:Putative alcohol dehydrogenase n=1 Tax=Diplodia seriata TaxID=420778 RepID=A0A0G2DUC1_9PEZI|nr:putative alcohol dehydrogenase [Diplodia seriata]
MAKVKTDLTMKGAAMAVPTLSGLSIPSTQRAAITPTVGKTLSIAVHQVPVRPPRPTEALVKISHTGLCRSDASFSTGPSPGFPQHDHIAGHEAIGAVVQSHDPSLLGRVVGIRYLGATCGSCAYCARGLPTSCPAQLNIPKHVAGTFQEYATLPTSSLVPLPQYESILDEAAASTATTTTTTAALCAALCSGSAALTALRAAGIVDVAAAAAAAGGKVVVVVSGVGGAIGHLAGAMARRVFGARVVGIDVGPKRPVGRAASRSHG